MKKKLFNLNVSNDYAGNRLDKFLQSQLVKFSRTRVQNLICDGFVKINNIIVSQSSKKINWGECRRSII